ncbi:acidic mammalian chitinase-like [Hydractinia symbiolongicarpus]|uniref:acidic mammalian chitinase-like n=1 Tax=Hydractinia symbiolongicarpus TaxID=13093 RepID=UPI0025515DF1|nr:acidic mammalian chitinase-like [Hydractinia symbiolongicarpus]
MVKLLLFFALLHIASSEYIRVCYVTNWAQNRQGVGHYNISTDYEDKLCTHIIYAFANVTSDGSILPYEKTDIPIGYKAVNAFKKRDPNLKTLLAVGGWIHGSVGFTDIVKTPEGRWNFITKAISYLKKHDFNGLDLDWEYPAQRGSPPGDRHLFTLLCEELKREFSKHNLLVTAAVAAGVPSATISYEIYEISKHLDFINLMSYDLHGSWESSTGHHTDANEARPIYEHSVYISVDYWLSSGMDPSKLILGLAAHGRGWLLRDGCREWNLGTRGRGGSTRGNSTRARGILAYYEICDIQFQNRICTSSSSVNAPYGSNGQDFIGYDDEESIAYKVKNIMKKKNLGGFMFWTIDLDDFSNHCGTGKFPLIKAATAAVDQDIQPRACQNITHTGECPPPPTLPPNKCRVNPIGPWKGRIEEDEWCKDPDNCPNSPYCVHYKGCTSCVCECDDDVTGTAPPTISTVFTKASTTLPTKSSTTCSTTSSTTFSTKPSTTLSTKYSTTLSTKSSTTLSTLSKISTTSTESPVLPGACTVPTDQRLRRSCYINPQGLWKGDAIDLWCKANCRFVKTCATNMCCCDSGN